MSNNEPTIRELEYILRELNAQIPDSLVDLGFNGYVLNSNGFEMDVEFAGTVIWNSEDDRRDYIDGTEDYEDLTCYLLGMSTTLIIKLSRCMYSIYIDTAQ